MIKCPICGKEFYTVNGLRSHLAVKHPGDSPLSFEDVKKAIKIALYEAEKPLTPIQLLMATKTVLRRAFLVDVALAELKKLLENALQHLLREGSIRIYLDPSRKIRYGLSYTASKSLKTLTITVKEAETP